MTGDNFGEIVFQNQVKELLNYNEKIIIAFPDHIKDIAISFVQGFTRGILEHIDKSEFDKYFKISGCKKVKNKFVKSLYY